MSQPEVHVVGGGLAGVEAAYQCLRAGMSVVLHEMRPEKSSPAHRTDRLAELVCSNSLKSMEEASAPGLLKAEMRDLDSLVIAAGVEARVPAGKALAVDREVFSRAIEQALEEFEGFERRCHEVVQLPSEAQMCRDNQYWIVATGPLTSDGLAAELSELCGGHQRLFFYDAIAPTIERSSIDESQGFWANRWDPDRGEGDYFNLPLTKQAYETFVADILAAEMAPLHGFESTKFFESCLPIEVMASRGPETLRFGPMRPVGLRPKAYENIWAVVQLRLENKQQSMLSMVGFQTKMKWPEQKRIFSKLPGLAEAEFLRLGSIHRNTFIESPKVLNEDLSFKSHSRVFLAGQLTGVEGYTESAALGLLAGRFVAKRVRGEAVQTPPAASMMGALHQYVTQGSMGTFQPMNANLGLLPQKLRKKGMSKQDVKLLKCADARQAFQSWLAGP